VVSINSDSKTRSPNLRLKLNFTCQQDDYSRFGDVGLKALHMYQDSTPLTKYLHTFKIDEDQSVTAFVFATDLGMNYRGGCRTGAVVQP
jgi:hypothetical protein